MASNTAAPTAAPAAATTSCFADFTAAVQNKYTWVVDKVATNSIDFRGTFKTEETTGTVMKVMKVFGELLATIACFVPAAVLGTIGWVKNAICNCSKPATPATDEVPPANTAAATEAATATATPTADANVPAANAGAADANVPAANAAPAADANVPAAGTEAPK